MQSQAQGHGAARRIMSIKNSNDNRTRDLPICNAVPQPTAPPRTLLFPVPQVKIFFTQFTVLASRHKTFGWPEITPHYALILYTLKTW